MMGGVAGEWNCPMQMLWITMKTNFNGHSFQSAFEWSPLLNLLWPVTGLLLNQTTHQRFTFSNLEKVQENGIWSTEVCRHFIFGNRAWYTHCCFWRKKSSITQRLKVKHAGKSVGDIKFSIFPPECLLFSCKVNQILSSGRWELYESLKSAKQTLFPHTLTWLLWHF